MMKEIKAPEIPAGVRKMQEFSVRAMERVTGIGHIWLGPQRLPLAAGPSPIEKTQRCRFCGDLVHMLEPHYLHPSGCVNTQPAGLIIKTQGHAPECECPKCEPGRWK